MSGRKPLITFEPGSVPARARIRVRDAAFAAFGPEIGQRGAPILARAPVEVSTLTTFAAVDCRLSAIGLGSAGELGEGR